MVFLRPAPRALVGLALASLVLLTAPPHVTAQAPDPTITPLEALLRAAVADNPALEAARLDAEALGARVSQAAARPNPTVGVTAFPAPILTARGAQQVQVRAEQRFPWPGTLALRAEAAAAAAGAAAARVDAQALDLALAVKEAYVDLARVQATRRHVDAFRTRLAAFADAAVTRYEVGRGPQSAILQVQLARERLRTRLLDLAAEEARARQTLARLLDAPALGAFEPMPLASLIAPGISVADEEADAVLARRPKTAALDAQAARAEAEAALARKARYPDLGVNVTYFNIGDRAVPPSADGRDAFAVGVAVSLPLDRRRQRALTAEARLRAAQAEAERAALAADVAATLADLRAQLREEAAQIALYTDRLLPQAAATAESVLAAYTTGQADYLALLEAERTRFDLRLALDAARARYARAIAALERALGLPPTTTALAAD